jgi:hypothetical protein
MTGYIKQLEKLSGGSIGTPAWIKMIDRQSALGLIVRIAYFVLLFLKIFW